MRAFLLHWIALLAFLPPAFCQNNVPAASPTNSSEPQRWNLDKYVWSHTHYKNIETDKPAIDFDAIDNWPGLGEYVAISRDGNYFAYTLERGIKVPDLKRFDSLVVQSTTNSWRRSFSFGNPGFFSSNSKQYIFQDQESLYFLAVGEKEPIVVKEVLSYKVPGNKKNEWIAYQLKSNGNLILQKLQTGRKTTFANVSNFSFDNSCRWLICQANNETKDLQLHNLQTGRELRFASVASYAIDQEGNTALIKSTNGELSATDLKTGKAITIWQPQAGEKIIEFSPDATGSQAAFTVEDKKKQVSIWYYKKGMDKAVLKVNSQTRGIEADLLIQPSVSFTDNNNYVMFSLQPKPESLMPMADAVQLDVWSYKDTIFQSSQPYLLKQPKIFSAVLNTQSGQVIQLEKPGERAYLLNADFAIVKKKSSATYGDRYWEEGYGYNKDSNWLVSLKDGTRKLLPTKDGDYTLFFSPGGRYLVYYDGNKKGHYFSYDLRTGTIKDISLGVTDWKFAIVDPYLRTSEKPSLAAGIAGWLQNDAGLLVYDDYDIWQLDPTGNKPPINITNGYGKLHNTLLSLMNGDRLYNPNVIISEKEPLLIRGFNRETKYNGFYRKALGKERDPELLYMGPCFFKENIMIIGMTEGLQPLKAAAANNWIVQRQTATEAPNYFVTSDFKTYKPLTNLQPHKSYNWLTTELVSFQQLDGTTTQGVLYKPENFDPKKKYPVIITFYGQLSDRLYQYPNPSYLRYPTFFDEPSWFVSHGYLVFVPDIYFTQGQWGPSVVNTMDGAAGFLRTLPYVDSLRLGVSGHSNSGRFGYYLLTHSKSFAAMALGAATTEIISMALSVNNKQGRSTLDMQETGTGGYYSALGNLWENKESWLDHTSVLHADNVTSPLLMFHCKADGGVPVSQAVEMFTALRRLQKPAWWLQYDEGSHLLHTVRDLRDFSIRYTQFFDYYLKSAPAPRWMSEGLPYKFKGIENRYEIY